MRYAHAKRKRPCTPSLLLRHLPEELAARLDNCSMCDYHPLAHTITQGPTDKLPAFPPRLRKHFMCHVQKGRHASPPPPTKARLLSQYTSTRQAIEQHSFASCICQATGAGSGMVLQGRTLPKGLDRLQGVCTPDRARPRIDVQIERMSHDARTGGGGGKHMVLPGVVVGALGERQRVSVRAALPRGWGQPGFVMETPRTMRCQADGRGLDPSRCEAKRWAAFQQTCRLHLGTQTSSEFDRLGRDDLYGAAGKDLAMGLTLQGAEGWPQLVGAGCCMLPVSDRGQRVTYVPLPIEVRELLVENDPLPRPRECDERRLSAADCARLSTLRSLETMHVLTELHHAALEEHVNAARRELLDGQFCFSPRDNRLMVCDTDFVRLWDPRAWGHPPSWTTAVRVVPRHCPPSCRMEGFFGLRADDDELLAPNQTALVDLPLAFAATVLRPQTKALPLLASLVDEIEARHAALTAGDTNVRQLTFSCAHAWLRVATRSGSGEEWT